VLAVTVTKDGDAASVRVVESSGHAMLDRAAKDAVRAWRFRPAERLGRAVRDRIRVPIRFRLKQG
jgi:protein TonB